MIIQEIKDEKATSEDESFFRDASNDVPVMPNLDIIIPEKKKRGRKPKEVGQPIVETVDTKPTENKDATFIPIEIVSTVHTDPFKIYNENPNYVYHWCLKTKMSNNRKGIWHTVPKGHSDFEGLRTEVDHTPDQSFFSFGDLILCCARKETVESRRKTLFDRNQKRGSIFEKNLKEKIDKLTRDQKDGISQKMVDSLDEAII